MKKFWQNNKQALGFIFMVFIAWVTAINLISLISPLVPISQKTAYNYSEKKPVNPTFFWNRANYDGMHYLDISRKGYGIYQQAFFPLYPRLIHSTSSLLGGKDLMAALIISNLAIFLSLIILYRLVLIDFDHKVAQKTIIFLLLFPTSFFFGFVYTESLFLFFVLASFYAARKKSWLLVGILGALASNTRIVGILLLPALLYEGWEQYKLKNSKFAIRNLLPVLMIPLGLLSYMRYLMINFKDPLMFVHVQTSFGAGRSSGKIILLYQVFYRYLKMILTTKFDPLYFTVWLELSMAVSFIYLLIMAYKKQIRASYLVFAVFAFLVPTLSGTFLSMPRFVLILFPCFIFLGTIKNKKVIRFLQIIFVFLAILCTLMFIKGYWIS